MGDGTLRLLKDVKEFVFVTYIHISQISMALNSDASYFTCKLPLETMSSYMNVKELRDVSSIHCIPYRKTDSKDTHIQNFIGHHCPSCDDYTFVFTPFTENKKLETKKMAL